MYLLSQGGCRDEMRARPTLKPGRPYSKCSEKSHYHHLANGVHGLQPQPKNYHFPLLALPRPSQSQHPETQLSPTGAVLRVGPHVCSTYPPPTNPHTMEAAPPLRPCGTPSPGVGAHPSPHQPGCSLKLGQKRISPAPSRWPGQGLEPGLCGK